MEATVITNRMEDVVKWFFSDEGRAIYLKEGEVLLEQQAKNNRIFYVHEGRLLGFLPNEEIADPIFEAKAGEFVGVYSFFSRDHESYSQVVSTGDSKVVFFEGDPFEVEGDKGRIFQKFLFAMVVEELRSRQHFAGQMARERQKSMRQLIKSEKMALLGEMAAGLAHELNNAVGTLRSSLDRIRTRVEFYLQNANHRLFDLFQKGLHDGPEIGSKHAREMRSSFERLKGVDRLLARQLAKTGITPSEVQQLQRERINLKEAINHWETGTWLHDMQIAADHATHVVKSVRELGVANQTWSKDVDVAVTIQQSLTVLASMVKKVELELKCPEDLPKIQASHGELMQVWINIVKNAIESLLLNRIKEPKVTISCRVEEGFLRVTIHDNGPGIPKEFQEKVFLPSFTTKVGGLSFGLGLGLTIVQRIVEEHRGAVDLKSEPGSTAFEISLPIVESEGPNHG